jgi:RNA polymerase sigma-70 factor (ECF subfamily)
MDSYLLHESITDEVDDGFKGRHSGIRTARSKMSSATRCDQWLVKQIAQSRDQECLETLHARFRRRIGAFLKKQRLTPEMVEELTNDTFLVVWTHAHRFRGESEVSTWIHGIALRLAWKALRHLRRSLPLADGRYALAEVCYEPWSREEDRDWFAAAARQLPQEQADALILAYQWGESYANIAGMFNCPVNTIKSRVLLARRKMNWLLPDLALMPTTGRDSG